MSDKNPSQFFDKRVASSYDARNGKWGPLYDNLHFLIRLLLEELPSDAGILCVGVGTGTEILKLSEAFPEWRFTGIDPSADMLEVCRERLRQHGVSARCELIHGYLDDLSQAEEYDAVLCLLVTHFIRDAAERRKMFAGMYGRLKPMGYLINADISYDMGSPQFQGMVEKWKRLSKHAGASEEGLEKMTTVLQEQLSVLPPSAIEDFLRRSGFPLPTEFFQALLIRAWYSQKI